MIQWGSFPHTTAVKEGIALKNLKRTSSQNIPKSCTRSVAWIPTCWKLFTYKKNPILIQTNNGISFLPDLHIYFHSRGFCQEPCNHCLPLWNHRVTSMKSQSWIFLAPRSYFPGPNKINIKSTVLQYCPLSWATAIKMLIYNVLKKLDLAIFIILIF